MVCTSSTTINVLAQSMILSLTPSHFFFILPDMIALPDFTAGAMENWGLITYRDTALLYEDGVSSESQKQRVCAIVAHELAHQVSGSF